MRLLLTLLFYGVLTPLALLLRALRIDPLARRWDARAGSYWRTRPPAARGRGPRPR